MAEVSGMLGIHEGFGGVLDQLGPPEAVGDIDAAFVKAETGIYADGTGWSDDRHTGFRTKVADRLFRFRIASTGDTIPYTGLGKRQDMYGTVVEIHVIHGAPADDIGSMVVADASAIRMPFERHAHTGPFDHELIPEQIGLLTNRSTTDVSHQWAEQKLAEGRIIAITVGHHILPAAFIHPDFVGPPCIHLLMYAINTLLVGLDQAA